MKINGSIVLAVAVMSVAILCICSEANAQSSHSNDACFVPVNRSLQRTDAVRLPGISFSTRGAFVRVQKGADRNKLWSTGALPLWHNYTPVNAVCWSLRSTETRTTNNADFTILPGTTNGYARGFDILRYDSALYRTSLRTTAYTDLDDQNGQYALRPYIVSSRPSLYELNYRLRGTKQTTYR